MQRRAQLVLRTDAGAALAAGLFVLSLHGVLAQLYGFSPALVLTMGAVNIAYGAYSGALALRAARGKTPVRGAIDLLVAANLGWAAVCGFLVAQHWHVAGWLGLLHVAFEGLFVGTLALLELRFVRPDAG